MLLLVAVFLLFSAPAAAQQPATGSFVIDARGVFGGLGPNEDQAGLMDVEKGTLPATGLGLDAGAHWYPLKWKGIIIGLGGAFTMAGGSKTPVDAEGQPTGLTTQTRFRSVTGQVSLNFGGEAGWSYVSGGLGFARHSVSNDAFPPYDPPKNWRTFNVGGGARWFLWGRWAFSMDFRLHRIPAQGTVSPYVVTPCTSLFLISAGISLR